MPDDDKGGLFAEFEEFLAAKQAAAAKASQSEYDGDDYEWWTEDKDGNRQGARTSVRAARQHGPDWVKEFFTKKDAKDDKGGTGDSQGDGGKQPPKSLFPARKPPAGQQGS